MDTVYPGSSDPFYIVGIEWVTTSWTYSMNIMVVIITTQLIVWFYRKQMSGFLACNIHGEKKNGPTNTGLPRCATMNPNCIQSLQGCGSRGS